MRATLLGALIVAGTVSTTSAAQAARPLGKTIDVPFDATRVTQHAEEAYVSRLYLAPEALAAQERDKGRALPLVVFLHGVNTDHRAFRFAGHGGEPDIRDIAARLMGEGASAPFVVGAPSSVVSSDFPLSLWPAFDLDRFVEDAARHLRPFVALDLTRVIVVGHSGAACNPRGGLLAAVTETTLALRGVLLVDTCLDLPAAPVLAALPPSVDVVITYQTRSWNRPFDEFGRLFLEPRRERTKGCAGALSVFEARVPDGRHVHNAMVEDTLRAYLPRLLPAKLSPKRLPIADHLTREKITQDERLGSRTLVLASSGSLFSPRNTPRVVSFAVVPRLT